MVGVLIQMKLSIMANTMSPWRVLRMVIGGVIGLSAAVLTILMASVDFVDPRATTELLAVLLGIWTLGWLLGPIFGGGSDETLRPEYFKLVPIQPHALAMGLLSGSVIGVTMPVTLAAVAALLPFGLRLGPEALVVAVAALVLQLSVMVLMSRVLIAALGTALRSRLGMDLIPLVLTLLISGALASALLFWEPVLTYLQLLGTGEAPPLPAAVLALPSSWGAVAVEAAGASQWGLVVLCLLGLLVADLLLIALWARLLLRRMTTKATAGRSRSAHSTGHTPRPLFTSPTGAAAARALRTWQRDAGMHIIVVSAAIMGVLFPIIGLITGWPYLLPFAGLLILVIALQESSNLFGFDGSALWHNLVVPGSERPEVRGRQVAWLVVFGSTSLLVTLICLLLPQDDVGWALPWVLSMLPAILGAGSGLALLYSVLAGYPVGADADDNAFASAAKPGVRASVGKHTLLPLLSVSVAPTAVVVGLGVLFDTAVLAWSGVPVGIATGVVAGWWWGRVAHHRLVGRGPELLADLCKPS